MTTQTATLSKSVYTQLVNGERTPVVGVIPENDETLRLVVYTMDVEEYVKHAKITDVKTIEEMQEILAKRNSPSTQKTKQSKKEVEAAKRLKTLL